MKALIIFLIPFLCFSQSKEALIDSVLTANSNSSIFPSPQQIKFQELKNALNHDEFTSLANHENGTIRMYTCHDLIKSGKGNPFLMFKNELAREEEIDISAGCTSISKYTSAIVYDDFWTSIQENAGDSIIYYPNDKPIKRMSRRAGRNVVMNRMDSLAIFTDKHVSFRIWGLLIENNKISKKFLPRIEYLAFNKNNAIAMEYLLDHYPRRYKKKAEAYFKDVFQTFSFKSEDEMYYYHGFTEILLKTGKPEMTELAIAKLKSDDLGEYKSWFNELLAGHNLPALPEEQQ
ncbi:hypothetical protein [Flavobacterium psychrotrophum]|uniref:hypothetical protein n=1 Tax=Flavobacterium psychrotrophum TaxID=2294119 RepID=UPI000E317F3B|nr:hypothetical protein [Flavobacterium psychrotrophum]